MKQDEKPPYPYWELIKDVSEASFGFYLLYFPLTLIAGFLSFLFTTKSITGERSSHFMESWESYLAFLFFPLALFFVVATFFYLIYRVKRIVRHFRQASN